MKQTIPKEYLTPQFAHELRCWHTNKGDAQQFADIILKHIPAHYWDILLLAFKKDQTLGPIISVLEELKEKKSFTH